MKRLRRPILITIAFIFSLWLIFEGTARLFAEILWFEEVDYLSTFITRRTSQYILWFVVSSVSGLFLGVNLWLVNRWQWQWLSKDALKKGETIGRSDRVPPGDTAAHNWYYSGIPYLPQDNQQLIASGTAQNVLGKEFISRRYSKKKTYSPRLNLPFLLLSAIALSVSITLILLRYTEIGLAVWKTSYQLSELALSSQSTLNGVELNTFLWRYIYQISITVISVVLLLFKPRITIKAIAGLISLVFGFIAAGNWAVILRFLNPSNFDSVDPQFQKNISFYIFRLPFWQLIETWCIGLSCTALIACTLYYLLSGNSLSEGRFPGFSKIQLRHLSFLGAGVMVSIAIRHWLNRFDLLYGFRGVVYGAGYTNITVQLPIEVCLTVISIISALWLLYKGFVGYHNRQIQKLKLQRILFLALPFTVYLLIFSLSNFFSATVQRLAVEPNELVKEKPFIERSIAMTRKAFNLDSIEAKTFNPKGELTAQDINNNNSTIKNIRLWDTRPILQTNRQLQQIRPYYQFHDADIDRYLLSKDDTVKNGDRQQVIIAARELDYAQVINIAKTWVNEHLIYTHGYGFTLSPVNRVADGGLPYYYVKDIGEGSKKSGTLTVSDETIRNSIPIGKPRIYYGELTNPYIMTSTKVRELDFPSGEENVYTVYDGQGGIKIGNYFRRVLFAEYLKDWQMLFAQNFTADTKLLFRRNIKQRIKTIAPFLNYDRDPYLVAGKTKSQNNLYWIVDAYTTSDRYPYSDPGKNDFNYLRNSVKVVIDAYNGKVDFYVADEDPIVQTWEKIFPKLFKPLSAMPLDLRRHIRYPEDLFSIQSERLLTYHMTDPQVFYNREDQWQIPKEIYGTKPQAVAPYYLITKLPTAREEEFILLHPYTPASRPNLIAWLAARSDGAEYGKLLLYKFPKQKLIYGPNQIEALINQDPVISQQISLWNREGSRAIQGNLLIIPIEQSLLYVEPLYIEAEQNSLPALTRVIVIYENQIVMAETLEEGINAIFQPQASDSNAIVRPVEDVTQEN
ncbi:UPF0182 family protein [Waterburya agarophytonicola K14]|uniref:UPF0182 protein I4641_03110 n=1 Tax=Waterburya agarophytonicola KI4 TaxID=2874699 RepID=A0A964BM68_9CYAN|nr:UPF0182 family protein [Waterburya agarophytonicola]MCC0175969.1 UPF0182 family protein [Waterburya agarophytonicola KI4]